VLTPCRLGRDHRGAFIKILLQEKHEGEKQICGLHGQNSHSPALAWSLATTTYNCAMASAEHSSDQARDPQDVRLVVDTIPTLAWSARSDGSADFFNQRWLDYIGLSAE
jgi:hypothetical protein